MRQLNMKDFVRTISQQENWAGLERLLAWTVETGIQIQQIPAPTFAEEQRAAYVAQQFSRLGLDNIDIDEQKNVYGLLKGLNRSVPAVMVMAHTDTVFSEETDLSIRRENGTIYGPGLGDNSMGVAGMLGLARWLYEKKITPDCDIWFVASSCEEGLGDLKGVRKAYNRLKDTIASVINLEGLAFGHIYHAGIAVHRMHITANAEGGHSWLHFGRPSAVHGIMELGAQISRIVPPSNPRTTFNIGVIEGGTTINSIATEAGLWLDLRSEDSAALERIRKQVLQLISAAQRPKLTFKVEIVGDRPAGSIDPKHPLVLGALEALAQVGVRGALETGSTDGNIPLENGCPTVTIGITRGGNAHRLDEYIETAAVEFGMKQLILLILAATAYQRAQSQKLAGD